MVHGFVETIDHEALMKSKLRKIPLNWVYSILQKIGQTLLSGKPVPERKGDDNTFN